MGKIDVVIYHRSQMVDPEYAKLVAVPHVGDFVGYGQWDETRNYQVIKVYFPRNVNYVELTVDYVDSEFEEH